MYLCAPVVFGRGPVRVMMAQCSIFAKLAAASIHYTFYKLVGQSDQSNIYMDKLVYAFPRLELTAYLNTGNLKMLNNITLVGFSKHTMVTNI